MSKKKVHHEEHVDETWLIPYADMLTLLLALFIVMFAMSKTDTEKLKRVSEQFSIIFSGGSSVLERDGGSSIPSKGTDAISNNAIEQDVMVKIKQTLEEEFKKSEFGDKVKVELNKEGLDITIQDAVLFKSGDANVLKEISPLLLQISKTLSGLQNNIKILGHTDNVPISTGKFRSNWDLSASRAINVMQFMVISGGLPQEKISIQAFGEYSPRYDNSTAEGRAKNRRVEIVVVRNYPVDSK